MMTLREPQPRTVSRVRPKFKTRHLASQGMHSASEVYAPIAYVDQLNKAGLPMYPNDPPIFAAVGLVYRTGTPHAHGEWIARYSGTGGWGPAQELGHFRNREAASRKLMEHVRDVLAQDYARAHAAWRAAHAGEA